MSRFVSNVDFQGEVKQHKVIGYKPKAGYKPEVGYKGEVGYKSKPILSNQLTHSVKPFQNIQLPSLSATPYKPIIASLPAITPVPVYRPSKQAAKPLRTNIGSVSYDSSEHLPTFYRPLRDNRQPSRAAGGEEEETQAVQGSEREEIIIPSATVTPTELVKIGNKLRPYVPGSRGRSGEVPIEVAEKKEKGEDNKEQENKVYEMMRIIRKIMTR